MRYTKRDREDAAEHCSRMACGLAGDVPGWCASMELMSLGAAKLSGAATGHVNSAEYILRRATGRWFTPTERWAEAEALIRTGWTPQSAARRARKAGR